MSEKMRLSRTLVRFLLAESLIVAVAFMTLLMVRELPSAPAGELIALLGTIFGGLMTSLGFLVHAVSRNPSDTEDGQGD